MNLTQQFLIISIFPLSFLGMLLYMWRAEMQQQPLRRRWSLVLLAAIIWASSLLRIYGGIGFSRLLVFSWGVVGDYAFSVLLLGVLLTTIEYLSVSRERGTLVTAMSIIFILCGLVLDPRIWRSYLPPFTLAEQSISQFDLWGAVWVAGWFLPLLTGWLLTRQISATLPLSLYRKKISYWLVMMGLLFGGGIIISIHQPGQSFWQQAGALFIIPALLIGTISIVRTQLPDLQLTFRKGLRRLSGTLVLFALTWGALWFLLEMLESLTPGINTTLVLVLSSAIFAGLFTVVYRMVDALSRRLFLPAGNRQAILTEDYTDLLGYLPLPAQLGRAFLAILEWNLNITDAWLLTTENGPGGSLLFRPLTHTGAEPPEIIHFAGNSPFTTYFHEHLEPLVHYDLELLQEFADLSAAEREKIARWQRIIYVPLRAGSVLTGLLALGPKHLGDLYTPYDFQQLQFLAGEFSPLLAQARNMSHMRTISAHVFRQNQVLDQERQQLQSLVTLYNQFVQHISPALRRPFRQMNEILIHIRENWDDPDSREKLKEVQQQLADMQIPLDKLINTAARLQNRAGFQFETVQLDEIVRQAQQRLLAMAEARRVRIDFESGPPVPPILGDQEQLEEAVQHLLHNAIKFNKIGGVVTLTCGTVGGDVYLRILDTGVGIPENRLQTLWRGFPSLAPSSNGKSRKASLGLTLANFIVTAHGGRIEAESKYGSGSVFSLYLPLVLQE